MAAKDTFAGSPVVLLDPNTPEEQRTAKSGEAEGTGLRLESKRRQQHSSTIWTLKATVERQMKQRVSLGWEWRIRPWNPQAYVLMPGALYAGNRFEVAPVPYSPRYPAHRAGPQMPPIISDVPRLELDSAARSCVELLAGDMAWPALGIWDPQSRRALLWTAPSHTAWGEVSWTLEEPSGHEELIVRILAPGIRHKRYVHMQTDAPSPDRGYAAKAGDSVIVEVTLETWDCPALSRFFEHVFQRGYAGLTPNGIPPTCSFSQSLDVLTAKYHRDNWHEDWGLFMTVTDPDNRYPYQTGWCGGGIAARALLASRDHMAADRARENIDRVCHEAQTHAGLIFGKRNRAGWISDFHGQEAHPHTARWTLTRRQGDALYYLGKSIAHRENIGGERLASVHPWKATLRGLARGLQSIFRNDGQWGHFLDQASGSVLVGGTTSGGIIPAGLVLASKILDDPALLETAVRGAEHYLTDFTRKGLATGGPADALGNPDSESAAALLESYIAIWEATEDGRWLQAAAEAAHQAATWVMPYAYPFPADTEFGQLRMNTTGTVFANAQNKHSAPGICTHAGEGLLRLFRATGHRPFLNLLTSIARTLPQYLSRAERPIHDPSGGALPSGWMNERVNTSDWDNNLGGVFHGSCWCEISLLLSAVELPGVYWQPDTGILAVLDHVRAKVADGRLRLTNPLDSTVRVRPMIETSATARTRILNPTFAADLPEYVLPAGGVLDLEPSAGARE